MATVRHKTSTPVNPSVPRSTSNYSVGGRPIDEATYNKLAQLKSMMDYGVSQDVIGPEFLNAMMASQDTSTQDTANLDKKLKYAQLAGVLGDQGQTDAQTQTLIDAGLVKKSGGIGDMSKYKVADAPNIDAFNIGKRNQFNMPEPSNYSDFASYNPNPWDVMTWQSKQADYGKDVGSQALLSLIPLFGSMVGAGYSMGDYGKNRTNMYKEKFGPDYQKLVDYQTMVNNPEYKTYLQNNFTSSTAP